MTPEQKEIIRLKDIIESNHERHVIREGNLERELREIKVELNEIKRHGIKLSTGKYSLDYVMYCLSSRARIERQYDELQELYLALVKDNQTCRHLTEHFVVQ